MPFEKTGDPRKRDRELVLLHAAHHEAKDFLGITWGRPRDGVFGRAAKALRYLYLRHDAVLYVGCGALAPGAPIISHLVYSLMIERGREVPGLESFSAADLRALLDGRCHLDEVAQTTVDEIERAGQYCVEAGMRQLTLLSSPTHLPRCLRDALALRETPGSSLYRAGIEIGTCASDTNFADAKTADVAIFEPPHRADRHGVPVHRSVRTLFPRLGTQAGAEELNRLLLAIGDDATYRKLLAVVEDTTPVSA